MIASRDWSVPLDERLLQHLERRIGADVQNRAHRFALHLRLVVVEQFRQVGQRLGAAEFAQQVIAVRRTAGFGDPFSRSTVRLPTAPKAIRIAVSRSRGRGRSSFDSASASGRTSTSPSETHIACTRSNVRVVDRRQVRDDVAHHRAGDRACRSR